MATVNEIHEELSPEDAVMSRFPKDVPPLPEAEDEDFEEYKNFKINEQWNKLFALPGFHKIMLSPDVQKDLGIVVGVNVSQEFPWKQIKFSTLEDFFFDKNPELHTLAHSFEFQSDELILLGYMPVLTQNDTEIDTLDPFILYDTHFAQEKASQIIRNIESYEKWILNRTITKRSRPWKSLGSEKQVNLGLKVDKKQIIDVQLQSCYPMRLTDSKYNFRTTNDVRDGYVELVPGDKKFENISRRRINVGTQQAPTRITLEQQTDPTFPTNAWSQYLFQIEDEGSGLDEESEEEESKPHEKTKTPQEVPRSKLEISDNVKFLLKTLEFNQIDMYRNDYPKISSVIIPKYSNPYLEELLCFADMSKSINRYVCGADWYPNYSGLVVASYAFSTLPLSVDSSLKVDVVRQTIFDEKPVLMWSFDDSLLPKLIFNSPRQVTALSFCPYNGNILIGGTINGSIIIWDLMNRIEKLDYEEMLTTAQSKYRIMMSSYLKWSQHIDEEFTVYPAIVSAIDSAHIGAITSIKWLPRNQVITTVGKHIETTKYVNRFFITNSIDGTVGVWNLDINLDKKISQKAKPHLPKLLMSSESSFKKYDRIFKPIFKIALNHPLTNTIVETARFSYTPYNYTKSLRDYSIRYPIKVVTEVVVPKKSAEDKIKTYKLLSSTFFGQIASYPWEGLDFDSGKAVNKEDVVLSTKYANCHDGPIMALEQNPHYHKIFASVGRFILAIWKEDFFITPIMWRKRSHELTSCKWSLDRPSVLFITRVDGALESWDILARDDEPILKHPIGGGILSALSEHRPSIPKKIIGIGDYNSSFRMIAMPSNFEEQDPNEKMRLKSYIEKEILRKQRILEWEKNWLIKNADILEAKKRTKEEALKQLEELKKEADEKEAELKAEAATKKTTTQEPKKNKYDLPELLEKKWDEMMFKRLMEVLMIRKQVNAQKLEKETVLEKKRLAYVKSKKTSLKKKYLKKIDEDIAAVRARILPVAKEDAKRIELVSDSVNTILEQQPRYHEIEIEAINIISDLEKYEGISYTEFFFRGRKRRALLEKSLGANTDRIHYYNTLKAENNLQELNYKADDFIAMENRSESINSD